ncbi:MAG: 5-formyltetrahydrofolate cyclo-ligase, partial [Pseudomonadales bacterium]|nr:5-formyltetrahydrofolate cyclo-ligase [Pseudomonadales bacterium]
HYKNAKLIAAYLACDGEIDLSIFLAHAARTGKKIYVPVLNAAGLMRFVRYLPGAVPGSSQGGFSAPARGQLAPRRLRFDLVLLPLVAFDAAGNRLGRGGGHYDRYFSNVNRQQKFAPRLFGIAHAMQQAGSLQAAPWDVGLDAVASERGIQYFRGLQSRPI